MEARIYVASPVSDSSVAMTEELVSADTGEVVLLKVNYQQALQLEGEAQPAVGYCIMKRPGKLLVGPSCELHFPRASRKGYWALSLRLQQRPDSGEWVGVHPARDIAVLVADFADQALAGVEVLEEGLIHSRRREPESFSSCNSHGKLCLLLDRGSRRGVGYYTAEEHGLFRIRPSDAKRSLRT